MNRIQPALARSGWLRIAVGMYFLIGFSLIAVVTGALAGPVVINEICAANKSIVLPLPTLPAAISAYFPDYVELYNLSNGPVDITAWSLTDTNLLPTRYKFPAHTTIPANGYLMVYLDTLSGAQIKSRLTNYLHAGFNLSSKGASVLLYDGQQILQESNRFGFQLDDRPVGRVPDGSENWTLIGASPGTTNVALPLGDRFGLRLNEWLAVNQTSSGKEWFELFNPDANPVLLGGLVFTDSNSNKVDKYVPMVPLSFIDGGGFVQMFATGKPSDKTEEVNFSLSGTKGDEIWVFNDGSLFSPIDHIQFGPGELGPNISMGRLPDGGDFLVLLASPSPAASNVLPLTNVVVNEVLSHSDPPLEDAIELFNPGVAPVDLSYWWLSNKKSTPRKFHIPPGTILPAKGYKVYYEDDFDPDHTGNSPSFRLNSAHGDSVVLSTGDSNGNLTGYQLVQDFGTAENGVSFGRFIRSDGQADFTALSQLTFGTNVTALDPTNYITRFVLGLGATNSYPKISPIVINEIFYHPPDFLVPTNDGFGNVVTQRVDNSLDEFIELHNWTPVPQYLYDTNGAYHAPANDHVPPVPVGTIYADGATNAWRLDGGVQFDFPNLGNQRASLAPNGYLLVVNFDPAADPAQLQSFTNRFRVPGNIKIYGPYKGRLSNSKGDVQLLKPDQPQGPQHPDYQYIPYYVVDRVQYLDTAPWDTNNVDGGGNSLQRIQGRIYGNEPANWSGNLPTAGRGNFLQCTFALSANVAGFSDTGGITNVTVTTLDGCSWAVVNTNSWISLSSETGDGSGAVDVTVAANPGSTARVGHLLVGDAIFVVTQTAAGQADSAPPSITVAKPVANSTTTNGMIIVSGTAKDNVAIARVECSLNGADPSVASGTTTWMATIALQPGTNTLAFRSIDLLGNSSPLITRRIFYSVPATIILRTNGFGTVSPSLTKTRLEIGRNYTLTATPSRNFVFSNWNGSIFSASPKLTFTMDSNLVLSANFTTNPFIPAKGIYTGVFYNTDPAQFSHASSGLLTLSLTDLGVFSGKILIGAKTLPLAGKFDILGHYETNRIGTGTNSGPLVLDLNMLSLDQITGEVTTPAGTSTLQRADRAPVYNAAKPCPFTGHYTLHLSGSDLEYDLSPGGDSIGTISVDKTGVLTYVGAMADDTAVMQKTPLSASGDWPFYLPLYGGLGSAVGWLTIDTTQPDADIAGVVNWSKPAQAKAKTYSAGFTNQVQAEGFTYLPPTGTTNRILSFANGLLSFDAGFSATLPANFTDTFNLGAGNKVTNTSSQKLTLTFISAQGLFSGTSTTTSASNQVVAFKGVILQKPQTGAGYYVRSNITGKVNLGAAP